MTKAFALFHGELEDFLPKAKRGSPVEIGYHGNPSIKDLLESAGVPHPEIGEVRADGESIALSANIPAGGGTLDVFPLQGREGSRFILDCHLGRLAAYLRMI